VTLAVLLYVLHDAEVVPLSTWALVLPAGKVDAVKTSVWLGGEPVIDQPAPLKGSSDQTTPVPPGSASLTLTLDAAPGPALFTVTVNPICEPAFTDVASAIFTSERFGHCTVVDAFAGAIVWASAVAVALLLYALHDAAVVALTTCALVLPIGKLVAE
jgi:hypothetical protein